MKPEQAEHEFSEWLLQHGFGEHHIPADSQWHNFDVPGDRPGSKHGSAKLNFGDKIDGVVRTFNGIDPIPWYPGNGATANFTDEERQAWSAEIERKAREKKAAQEAAQIKAMNLHRRSKAATADHPYLLKKGITDVGLLKVSGNDLIVPLYNARTDEFQTFQRITPDGDKLFLTDSEIAGAYIMIGGRWPTINKKKGDEPIVICEGYATAYAIQQATFPGYCVISALNCGNLIEVAKILYDRFPLRDFIIAADNDIEVFNKRGFNPGIRDARKAALAINRKIAVPPPIDANTSGDFWDLWKAEGDAVVKKLIDEAIEPSAEEAAPPADKPLNGSADATILKRPPLNGKGPKGFSLTCTKDIIMKPKDWLWEGHLARGVQELLSGIPGLGKSQVQISYIASVTAGLPWPDGTKAKSPASVIMMTAEDILDQDVVPRLVAAGADLSRVHILKSIRSDGKDRQFFLGEDLDMLEQAVSQVGDVVLVTIDPITAYMGGKIDSHKATEVRSQLGPLKDFAEKAHVAVSTITHPAKNSGPNAIDHFIGSQAFGAAGRIGHVCTKEFTGDDDHKTETGRILFSHPKHSSSKVYPTLAYRIIEATVGQDEATRTSITAPHVVWDGAVDISADEAVRATRAASGGNGKKDDDQKRAQALIEEMLGGVEPVLVNDIYAKGKERGLSEDQLKRAKAKLRDVVAKKTSNGWTWEMNL